MPTEREKFWNLVWKVNQIIILPWAVWVTVNVFDARAHQRKPHASEPIEKDSFFELKLLLMESRVKQEEMAEDISEIKRGMNSEL